MSLSPSPLRSQINKASVEILKSELKMAKTQLDDARSTHQFLKKEKQNIEIERNQALQ